MKFQAAYDIAEAGLKAGQPLLPFRPGTRVRGCLDWSSGMRLEDGVNEVDNILSS